MKDMETKEQKAARWGQGIPKIVKQVSLDRKVKAECDRNIQKKLGNDY